MLHAIAPKDHGRDISSVPSTSLTLKDPPTSLPQLLYQTSHAASMSVNNRDFYYKFFQEREEYWLQTGGVAKPCMDDYTKFHSNLYICIQHVANFI